MRPSSALLALVCASCGALDPPASSLPPAADGLAPWTTPAPLELCLGGARLTPPSRDPGASGFCVATPAPRCVTDASCGPRERCVCGRCALALCRSDGDCASGAVCVPEEHRCARSCVTTADCGASGQCRAGACATPCTSRAECGRGEVCDPLGRCVAQPCRADAECGGELCDTQLRAAALRHPSVLVDAGRAVMFVEVQGEGILRAVSSDGVSFRAEPAAVVLAGRYGAPSVARLAGRWVLTLDARDDRSVAVSTSADGLRFGAPVTLLRAQEPWESVAVFDGALVADGEGLLLAYGASGGIGLARVSAGADGALSALRVRDRGSDSARVLDPARVTDGVLWRAVGAVESPALVAVTEASGRRVVRMYFSARGAESSASAAGGALIDPVVHRSVGVAARTAEGGFQVSPFNPVLSRGSSASEVADAREPAVFRLNGRWFMAMRGADLSGVDEGLLVAQGR